MTDMASQILAREEEERQTLELLLERHLGRGDKLLVQKTQMGNTTAFMGVSDSGVAECAGGFCLPVTPIPTKV